MKYILLLLILLAFVLALFSCLGPLTRQLIFTTRTESEYDFSHLTIRSNAYRIIAITNKNDGRLVYLLWVPHKTDPGNTNKYQGVFFMHGINSTLDKGGAAAANLFYNLNMNFLAIDYRGYGKSVDYFPSEESLYSDAEAGLSYMAHELNIPLKETILVGHSLGGAVATEMALRHTPAKLVLISTFTSTHDAVNDISLSLAQKDWYSNIYFDNLGKIGSIHCPMMLIHGKSDTLLNYHYSERLFRRANEPKQLFLLDNCGHDDTEILPKIGLYLSNELASFLYH